MQVESRDRLLKLFFLGSRRLRIKTSGHPAPAFHCAKGSQHGWQAN